MKSKNIFGIVLIALGALFLLNQVGILPPVSFIFDRWPLIIIGVGVSYLGNARYSLFVALLIISVGLILQLDQFDVLPWGFWRTFWPVLIIIIGISLLSSQFGKKKRHFKHKENFNPSNFLDVTTIFSGSKERVNSNDFQGGNISTIFGGCEIDLRDAKMAAEGAHLEITCLFGGVEVYVPANCIVKTNGTPFLGGMDNKTRPVDFDSGQNLYINFTVMFGGIEIRN